MTKILHCKYELSLIIFISDAPKKSVVSIHKLECPRKISILY